MLIDEPAHFVRSASSSVTKNTEAAFRISFARRSSNTSFAQRLDLLALLRGRQIRSQATIGLGLAHVLSQRLVVNPEISRHVTDRATRLDRQPHTALDQLIGILPWSWHRWRVS
jgi:hypothetical protein